MANLDTRNKRGSALGWNVGGRGRVWANPAAGELSTQAGRQHAGLVYIGILASTPVVGGLVNANWWLLMNRLAYYNRAETITKSDTVNFNKDGSLCNAIYVGGAGDVVVVFQNDLTATFTAVAGEILPVGVKRVNSASTTATGLLALYQT